MQKWLSHSEGDVLDRALSPEEVQNFTDTTGMSPKGYWCRIWMFEPSCIPHDF